MEVSKRLVLGGLLLAAATPAAAQVEIPRAPSTPNTPKNWVPPNYRMHAQALIDELAASHPEIISMTMHATPPGTEGIHTMFAGTFPDRIGNQSSPGDVITITKAVTQIEPKWGTPDWQQKVSVVAPLKDAADVYLRAAMVIAFRQSPTSGLVDTDFLAPGIRIRDSLRSRIPNFEALFARAR